MRGAQPEAAIFYYLKQAQKVKVAISDSSGNVVWSLDGTGDRGINMVVWNLELKGLDPMGRTGRAVAGKLLATLSIGDKKLTEELEVK